MTIKYITSRSDVPVPCEPAEDGPYLLRVDGTLVLAEWFGAWGSFGIDYDIWEFSSKVHEIEVIRKLDLEMLLP